MPQLKLNFLDIPVPQTRLWESLDNAQKQLLIEMLARLLLQSVIPATDPKEPAND